MKATTVSPSGNMKSKPIQMINTPRMPMMYFIICWEAVPLVVKPPNEFMMTKPAPNPNKIAAFEITPESAKGAMGSSGAKAAAFSTHKLGSSQV